jgi:hypothetical protein
MYRLAVIPGVDYVSLDEGIAVERMMRILHGRQWCNSTRGARLL